MSTVEQEDREIQRARALGAVFGKTNRIMTGDRSLLVSVLDRVQIERKFGASHSGYPGFTRYPNIVINSSFFRGFREVKTLVELLGLNYHELSHVMFTPRNPVITTASRDAFNVLEDQRIESLFTALYEPAGKYFTEMVIKMFVGDTSSWQSAFLYTYGRSFLPLEIREEFEARFEKPKLVEEAKQLINEYKGFTSRNFSRNSSAVNVVIDRFQEILNSLQSNAPTGDCSDPDPERGVPDQQTEKAAQKKEQSRREKEEETGEDQSGFWEEDEDESEDGEEESGDGEDGEEDSDGDSGSDEDSDDDSDDDNSDGEGGGEDNGDEDGSDSDDSSDEELDSDGETGAGTSDAISQFDDSELNEYLEDIQQAVQEDQSVTDEVKRISEAMNDESNMDFIDFEEVGSNEQDVTVEDTAELNRILDHFRRLYADVEPGWKYGSDQGKLNVSRAMADPENYDEMFDEWNEGMEHEAGIEAVISFDISGSMAVGNAIYHASRALWIIKRALDEVEAKTTVLGFHASTKGLYDRDVSASKSKWPVWTELGGSTRPSETFNLARRILNNTDMPNKLFICITDGSFTGTSNDYSGSNVYPYHELVKMIPGHRIYVGIKGATSRNHEVQEAFHNSTELGSSPDALVDVVRDAVTMILREKMR